MGSLAAQEPVGIDGGGRFLSRTFVPKTINTILKDVAVAGDRPSQAMKLDGFIAELEDEMKKIDAFRRELPLCMLLLNDAIVMLKDESVRCKKMNPQPMFEEFIPLKKRSYGDNDDEEEDEKKLGNDVRDKMNWMSSVQLWSSDDNAIKGKQEESDRSACNNRITAAEEDKRQPPVILPRLSLRLPEEENSIEGCNGYDKFKSKSTFTRLSMNLGEHNKKAAAKKKRRSWSPELHRRFISALEQLGGPQVATPKQIRELMHVDGLTNDEVKSHLQKYRLHMRKKQIKSSPKGPLHVRSNVVGDSFEEDGEDEKSESTDLSPAKV